MKKGPHPVEKLGEEGKSKAILLLEGSDHPGRDLGVHGHLGEKIPRGEIHHDEGEEDDSQKDQGHVGEAEEDGPDHRITSVAFWVTREMCGMTPPRGVGWIPPSVLRTAVMASGLTRSTIGTSRVAISCQRS